ALLYHFGNLSPNLSHLWSLAIEEQFYAVWPLVLLGTLALGLTRRRLAWLCVALALVAAIWRAALYQSGEVWLVIYIRTDARADALLIGAALALVRGVTAAVSVASFRLVERPALRVKDRIGRRAGHSTDEAMSR